MYFRAEDENDISFCKGWGSSYQFATTDGKRIAASGNIQTLMKADGSRLDISGKNYCYCFMFSECRSLTTAPALPATTLADYCYTNMFYNCTSLTTAPAILPATTLASECYSSMFSGCTSLTTAPALPAMTLASSCYNSMFNGCISLTTAPATLPATTLANYCYANMFYRCIALTTAPALIATTLAEGCYSYMFQDCKKLASMDVSFTTWNPTNATTNWVNGVGTEATGTKTFTCPSALPDTPRDASHIPSGWTKVDK